MKNPIMYHDGIEHISSDESRVHQGLRKEFHKIISTTHRDHEWAARGVHAKSHALLEGTLRVHDDLPEVLAQGLFSHPETYSVVIRLSAIPGDPLRDAVSGPRGFALKINDVKGPLLPDNEGVPVQDFLFVNGPVFAAPDAKGFLRTLKLLTLTTDRFEGLKAKLSQFLRGIQKRLTRLGRSNDTIGVLGGYLPSVPVADRFFSQVPLRFGQYIAKFDVVPSSESFQSQQGKLLDIDKDPLAIRHALEELFRTEGGSWTLRAQLCRDVTENPVEDAAHVWPEENNPYLPLATITVPPQEAWSKERAHLLEDTLSFSPWHGLEAHRPLGNIMRARREMYAFSSKLRTRLNGCPLHFKRSR